MNPGDLVLYDSGRRYTFHFPEPFRFLVLQLPKDLVEVRPSTLDRATACTISGQVGSGRALSSLMRICAEEAETLPAHVFRQLEGSMLGLVGAIATSFGNEQGTATSLETTRWLAERYIDDHLANHDLTPTRIAQALGVSSRYLHMAFESSPFTVAQLIRRRRLERCREDLANPQYRSRTLAAVAWRWGFHDAAHFSRAFKREYGEQPSTYRARW
jgi:AraC-like DNA-binding protein